MAEVIYKIGDILLANDDVYEEGKEKPIISKGEEGIIGFDGSLYMSNGRIFNFDNDVECKGYNPTGIAKHLVETINKKFPLDDFLAQYNLTGDSLRDEIDNILYELGMRGNSNES